MKTYILYTLTICQQKIYAIKINILEFYFKYLPNRSLFAAYLNKAKNNKDAKQLAGKKLSRTNLHWNEIGKEKCKQYY